MIILPPIILKRFRKVNIKLVPRGTVNFVSRESHLNVSRDEVEGNIEIRGKQNSLFPKGPVIKWFVI